ncbi:hypothetical protein BBP40_003074 [Aspergillus hancockii]|nr:hypothetical protein BBP40_003074 [Aspergillus hancockii]
MPFLIVSVSSAGGLGFLAAGYDVSRLDYNLQEAVRTVEQSCTALQNQYRESGILPIGVGFLNWGADIKLSGTDAGGHGLARSASVLTLVPEVCDALRERALSRIPILAAGGIVAGRGIAASLTLGSSGVVMGTRFLVSFEANIARGYQNEVLRASDGGISTVRSIVFDRVIGIAGWPDRYDGRGVINKSYTDAAEKGMRDEENKVLYVDELAMGDSGWGPNSRLTIYAGTGVGLVTETSSAAEIVDQSVQEAKDILQGLVAY